MVREIEKAAIQKARSFNRTVAERIGTLNDQFLQRSRPMNEARLLWEIGHDGAEVRELRSRLGIELWLSQPRAAVPRNTRTCHDSCEP